MKEIKYCPGTLAEGFDKYSPLCLKRVFNDNAEINDIADYINQISVLEYLGLQAIEDILQNQTFYNHHSYFYS